MKCKIQWIDSRGVPTPDDNDAVGIAMREAYREPYDCPRGFIEFTEARFPCCAEHAKRIDSLGHWFLLPLPKEGVES